MNTTYIESCHRHLVLTGISEGLVIFKVTTNSGNWYCVDYAQLLRAVGIDYTLKRSITKSYNTIPSVYHACLPGDSIRYLLLTGIHWFCAVYKYHDGIQDWYTNTFIPEVRHELGWDWCHKPSSHPYTIEALLVKAGFNIADILGNYEDNPTYYRSNRKKLEDYLAKYINSQQVWDYYTKGSQPWKRTVFYYTPKVIDIMNSFVQKGHLAV